MQIMQNDKNNESAGPQNIIRQIFTLAWPIILANVLQAAYQLTDSFWVGRLGGTAVAAVAISAPILFLSISLGVGLAVAGSILVAQYFGAKNQEMVNKSAAQTLLMVAAVSILLSIAGWLITPPVLRLMGAAADFSALAESYLRISFIGLVFNFSFFMFQSIMRSIGRPKVPLYIIGGTVILNFLLDPLFMYGYGFIPGLGVSGTALATIGTQSVAAIIGFSILFGGKKGIHLRWPDFRPDFNFIKQSFLLGLPASIDQSARSLGMAVMTSLVASFGTVAVGSYGAGSNMIQMSVIIGLGLASANATLVGQNLGAGNPDRAARTALYSAGLSFASLTAVGVILFFTAPFLVGFFVPGEPELIAIGSQLLRTVSLFFGFMGLQMAFSGVYQASGNTAISMSLTIISQWVIQLPIAYLLSRHTSLGLQGIWWSFAITNVITALISWLIFRNGYWRKKKLIGQGEVGQKVKDEIMAEEAVPYDY